MTQPKRAPRTGEGYVYVAATEAHPGLLKIGFTRQDPRKRVQQFSTGSPHPFQILDLFKVADPEGLEKALHRRFAAQRVNEGREFFAVGLAEVRAAVRVFAEEIRYAEDLAIAQKKLDDATKWWIGWTKNTRATAGMPVEHPVRFWILTILLLQVMGVLNWVSFYEGDWMSIYPSYITSFAFLWIWIVPVAWIYLFVAAMAVVILIELIDRKTNKAELEALRQRLAREMRLKAADLKV